MGYRYLNTGTAVPVFTAEPPVATKGSLYYNSDTDIFYISNGTQWNLVSNASPATTGGTVTIGALSETGTFSYNLGTDFEDDVDTDAQLIYTLASGTLPVGCSLPTTGNSAFTGTASGVSSNINYTWTIKATDTSGGTATQDYQQTINTVAPTVTGGTVTISAVTEGSSASYDVDANFSYPQGSTFSAYSLVSGSLPSGTSLNASTGVISGTMGEVVNTTAYTFTIRGTDTDGDTVDQSYSWTITNVPFTATGGTIATYAGYKSHTFTSSGTFTPNKIGSVDVLVVAGGGGGGGRYGGGGGAGGMRAATISVTAGSHSVVVGGGGSKGADGNSSSNPGGTSSILTISSIGGGGGGSSAPDSTQDNGGSGGGGSPYNPDGGTGGIGTSGQGYNGGLGTGAIGSYMHEAGGGGGAGGQGVAGNPTTGYGSSGGTGASNSYRTGSNITYAGGGGGGSHDPSIVGYRAPGGSGGGGASGSRGSKSLGINGTANLGGGGGGGSTDSSGATDTAGGNGGSGIVIIRYAV